MATKNHKKPVKGRFQIPLGILISVLVLGAVIFYVVAGGSTTIFLRESPAPADALPLSEYPLVYTATGEPAVPVRGWSFPSQSVSLESDGAVHSYVGRDKEGIRISAEDLQTSRGLRPLDSWEDFVEKYGDLMAYWIEALDNQDGYEPRELTREEQQTHRVPNITPRDYDEQYVKTGVIDLDEHTIFVEFHVAVRGSKVLYTTAERDEAGESYYWSINGRSGEVEPLNEQIFIQEFVFFNARSQYSPDHFGEVPLITKGGTLKRIATKRLQN